MSLEQGSGFRLPRLSCNQPLTREEGASAKSFHSFLTSPSTSMLNRALSDKWPNSVSRRSKFWAGKNPAQQHEHRQSLLPTSRTKSEVPSQKRLQQNISRENESPACQDQKPQQLVGSHAVQDFYRHYKKLTRVLEQNQLNGLANSPYTAILENSQKLNVLPACYGMIRAEGARNVLKLGNYKLGDKYSQVLSSGLKEMKDVEEYILSTNRLTDKGFNEVLSSVNPDVIKLDFSNNRIHSVSTALIQLLTNPDSRLMHLNLENNKLGDAALNNLVLGVTANRTLRYLNLRKNFLTRTSCDSLSIVVEKAKNLEQLYLGWVLIALTKNKLNGTGARATFQKLAKNNTLVVLDYSNNGLGQYAGTAETVAEFFSKNTKAAHVDLSYNGFPLAECQRLADALKENHTIYGIHFAGNHGYINHQGFLVFDDSATYDSVPSHYINGLEACTKRPYGRHDFSIRKDICWLCEGWLESTLEMPSNVPVDGTFTLHFSFDGFRKVDCLRKNKEQHKIKVMLPPSQVRAYYTVQDVPNTFPNYPTDNIQKVQLTVPAESTTAPELCVSVIKSTGRSIVTGEQFKEIRTPIVPRYDGKAPKKAKQWQFGDSVWAKQWKRQDTETTKKCFELDWQQSKTPNLIKNLQDQALAKQMLYENYRKIKEIYKHFAAWSPFGDVWAVALNPFTQFCNQAKLISKELPSKIIDLTFITTNSMSGADWKGNHQVPERGLTRFQFMEALVRLADEKYRKNGLFEQMSECINALLTDHLKPLYPKFEAEKWRTSVYFTQQNDALIKMFRPVFKDIYKKNSKLKVRPGDKAFMCLDEFKDICGRGGLFAPGCSVQRDCLVNFNLSMMTQIDQLNSQRIFRMTEIEFIEALARMSEFVTVEPVQGQPKLHHKFQQLISDLIQRVCSEQIRAQFPAGPSIFQGDTLAQN